MFRGQPESVGFDKRYVEQSPEAWEQAKVRHAYVRAALEASTRKTLADAITSVWEKLRKPATMPSVVSVYRWKRQYIRSGRDARFLMDNTHKRGNRDRRFPPETVAASEESISTI